MSRSRRKLVLGEKVIRELFDVPGYMYIDAVTSTFDPFSVSVHLSVDPKNAPWSINEDYPDSESQIIPLEDWWIRYSQP